MSMDKARLEIDFREIQRLSEELSATAGKVKREADDAGLKSLCVLKESWISPNADVFAGREVKVFERMGEISMDLDKLSRDIYDRAKLIYEAELRNILIAETLGHVFI